MSYTERAAREIMGYLAMCDHMLMEPQFEDIHQIIQNNTQEEAYFRMYGHYPSNPQI